MIETKNSIRKQAACGGWMFAMFFAAASSFAWWWFDMWGWALAVVFVLSGIDGFIGWFREFLRNEKAGGEEAQ